MTCHAFERRLADWVTQRLSSPQAAAMAAHRDACAACAREENIERTLQARWRALPTPPPVPDLCFRLQQRVAAAAAPPPNSWRRGPAWCAAATVILVAATLWPPRPLMIADEAPVVDLIAQMRQLPQPSDEPARPDVRRLLLGTKE